MIKRVMSLIGCCAACANVFAQCTVPENLLHKELLAEVVQTYSSDNPMSGQLFKMRFLTNDEYRYDMLKDDAHFSGTYTYTVIAKNIAVITASENFNDVPVEYTMTMVCDNQKSGYYIYQQTKGVNGVRSNTARYFLMD